MSDVRVDSVKQKVPPPTFVKSVPKLTGNSEKLAAQDKLQVCFKEFQDSFNKTKEAFSSFKTKCFFFPEPEFNKAFKESLQQGESTVHDMGTKLSSLFSSSSSKKPGANEEGGTHIGKKPQSNEHLENSFNLITDNSDVLAKVNLNITPPTSEAGNDDELSTVTQQPERASGKKRSHSREKPSEKVVKKPRRSLLDDYLCKAKPVNGNEVSSPPAAEKCKDSTNDEVEYEVENIISFKKVQTKFYYEVSWKGYGLDDCTWEPSEHLTDCGEVLLEFYKRRLIEREQTSSTSEMNNQLLPFDRDLQHFLREAFLTYIIRPIIRPSPEDKSRILKQLSTKPPNVMTKQEINDLVDKALSARKVERYEFFKQTLREQVIFQDLQKDRPKHQAQLRMWERSINSVCRDPAKIVVENDVDLELPPLEFMYINELKEGQGVTIPNDPVLGCECTDCFSSQTSCCASQMNSWFAYNKYGRLKISLGTPIYECNKRCPCPPSCSNRVVQKGRTFSLSIFRTSNGRGWGVKALEAIKKDSFVVEYVGEIITSEEAEHRGELYDKKGCTYLFDLDFNKGDQNPYTVDATKYGNVSHFINHSCDPNLVVFNVWVNCLDPDLPRLALFACRDIRKGEELTFDYNSGLESEQMKRESAGAPPLEEVLEEDDSTTPEKSGLMKGLNSSMVLKTPKGNRGLKYGKTECRCGAANCRKYFF